MPKRATAWGRGLLLYKEGGQGDGLVPLRREANYLAHVGADVRLPLAIGFLVMVVDVADRVGEGEMLRIPIVVRKPLVRKPLPVVIRQEPQQVGLLPSPNVHEYLCAARASSEKGGTKAPKSRKT